MIFYVIDILHGIESIFHSFRQSFGHTPNLNHLFTHGTNSFRLQITLLIEVNANGQFFVERIEKEGSGGRVLVLRRYVCQRTSNKYH